MLVHNDSKCVEFVSSGLDHNALARTLETILNQPGVRPELVTVRSPQHF
jgi:hypothetical protein